MELSGLSFDQLLSKLWKFDQSILEIENAELVYCALFF
jgi:hypothetical protein